MAKNCSWASGARNCFPWLNQHTIRMATVGCMVGSCWDKCFHRSWACDSLNPVAHCAFGHWDSTPQTWPGHRGLIRKRKMLIVEPNWALRHIQLVGPQSFASVSTTVMHARAYWRAAAFHSLNWDIPHQGWDPWVSSYLSTRGCPGQHLVRSAHFYRLQAIVNCMVIWSD